MPSASFCSLTSALDSPLFAPILCYMHGSARNSLWCYCSCSTFLYFPRNLERPDGASVSPFSSTADQELNLCGGLQSRWAEGRIKHIFILAFLQHHLLPHCGSRGVDMRSRDRDALGCIQPSFSSLCKAGWCWLDGICLKRVQVLL